MENEICENCGRQIGRLEQAWVYDNKVVCQACYNRLKESKSLSSQTRPNNPLQQANADFRVKINAPSGGSFATVSTVATKPGKMTAIGGMRLGAGVCNIFAGVVFSWLLFPLVMIPLGVIEIISASNLLKSRPTRPSGLKTIAILEIVAILTLAGWISVVVGIITLVFLADTRVKEYIDQL